MPRRHDNPQRSAARVNALGSPELDTVQAGQVLWIPKMEELSVDIGLNAGARNHPCVALSSGPDSDGMVSILKVGLTSSKP